MECSDGEKARNGVCVELSSQDQAIQGVFANSGLPFYILIMIALGFACLGMIVYYDKTTTELRNDGTTEDMKVLLVQQPLLKHVLQIFFASAGLISEFILAYYLIMTKKGDLLVPAALIFASRLVIAPYPALMVGAQLMMQSKVPLIDSDTGIRSLRYHIHKKKIFMGSKIYTGLMFMSLFEPPLLSFLP